MGYELSAGDDPRAVDGDVRFSLTIDGVMQRFVITHEALADHFGGKNARAKDPLVAFETGKSEIMALAATKYSSVDSRPNFGIIMLTSGDFD